MPWRRRLRSAARDRLGLKATALFLALMLWALVRLREPTEDVLPARLVPLLADGFELVGPVPQVRVLVHGNGTDVLQLHRTPPVIRRRVPSTTSGVVRLELSPANVTLPPGVQARVEEVTPRTVTLRLRRTTALPVEEDAAGVTTQEAASPRRAAPREPVRRDSLPADDSTAPGVRRGQASRPAVSPSAPTETSNTPSGPSALSAPPTP